MYIINKRFKKCSYISIAGEQIDLQSATQKELQKIHELDSSIVSKDAKPKKTRKATTTEKAESESE